MVVLVAEVVVVVGETVVAVDSGGEVVPGAVAPVVDPASVVVDSSSTGSSVPGEHEAPAANASSINATRMEHLRGVLEEISTDRNSQQPRSS
ncbi:MAG: hypothetical protein OXC98_11465 [bacterium]|nr:hypothetical protein [Acidimicrobiia bacterium]MCY4650969.1 hypothetical protein [bacterium]